VAENFKPTDAFTEITRIVQSPKGRELLLKRLAEEQASLSPSTVTYANEKLRPGWWESQQ
jgi:hypothetical protein